MAMLSPLPIQPGPATSGTGVVSIGPAGSMYTSMEQSGKSLLKTYCDDFPNTDKSFVIPPMFNSVYTEVMPEHSRGLNMKEKNKYDGALKNQSGERAEKVVYDMISEVLRKAKSRNPFLAWFNVRMDNDNKMKVRKHALLSELDRMDFTDIKTSGEFDCIIVVKELGTIHIEVKRTNNASNLASAESQLDSGVKFVSNMMNAIKGSQSPFPSTRLIAIPCESSKSPSCKTTFDSFVAHDDVCQNLTPTWNTMVKELEAKAARTAFTTVDFTRLCNILMGWYCSEPVTHSSSTMCIRNESCLSLPNQVTIIDEKVQRAEITSEEQKLKSDHEKQAPLSDVVRTNPMDIFQNASGIGLLYLTPTQHSLYYHFPQAIVHGHGGTGKTILCLMKIMDLVRNGANRKALFVAPSPSHLQCYSILVKNKFHAVIVEEVPLSQEANCEIVIITLKDFFSNGKIPDVNNFIGYDFVIDDLQDYYAEDLCKDYNLNKIGEFIQNHFIVAKSNNHLAWFCFDIVQSIGFKRLLGFFPVLNPQKSAPPTVNLKHVLRNTSEIISIVEEGRKTTLRTTVHPQGFKIVKEFFKGHLITSTRVQCHRIFSSVDQACLEQFVLKRLRSELDALVKTKHALQFSQIAILVDSDSVLTQYKKKIDKMLSKHFKSRSQMIETSIISHQKDRVILDVAKNVASFESPTVIYIRTDNTGQLYRIISRARTKLTIIDVGASPLPFKSLDSIEWYKSKNGFYNMSECIDALKNRNMKQIEKLVSENSECLKLRQDGLTAFLLASQLGSLTTMKICINHGASFHEKELVSGRTSAMLAAENGHLEALKYLLLKGVSVEEEDKNGNTILNHAVKGGNVECIKWIIQNYLYNTAILQKEVTAGNVEVLKILHSYGVCMDKVDGDGSTILDYAVIGKQKECLDWALQNYLQLVDASKSKTSILHHLAKTGKFEILKILRDRGVSLDDIDSDGNTILHQAVYNKQIGCVKWIIQHYPSLPYIRHNRNGLIFHEIASAGNLDMLQIFYDCGVSFDEVDDDGNTILDYAVIGGQEECFEWVLQSYPQLIDTFNELKPSTFHQLAKKDHFEILEILRDKGIDLEQADSDGNNILHHAVSEKKYDCFVWILQNYPQLVETTKYKNSSLLLEVASLDDYEMLDKLCDHKEALEETRYQKSLLHKAAICHDTEELRTLIENEMKSENCDAEETSVSLEKVHGDVTIFRDYGLVFKDTYSTVYAPLAWLYRGCKVYYEIEVVENEFTDNLFSVGLISSHFLPPESCRGKDVAYWGSPEIQLGVKRCTVGVAIDTIKSQMVYQYAGNSAEIMTFSRFDDSLGLFPAVNGQNITLHVNFGAKEFKHSPPDSSFKSVEELTKGTNILHVAARKNQVECCKYIIDNYPHLLNKTSGRGTPLHECASTGSFDSLLVLLDAGADMTITNTFDIFGKYINGSFIFHEIAYAGNIETLQVLHNYGVWLDKVDDDGNTILDYAAIGGQEECFKWVLQNYPRLFDDILKGGKTSTIHQLAKKDHFEILEILRDKGIDLEQADSYGNNILHHAVSERKYDCFVWILQNYPQLVETTKYKNSSILLEVASLEDYEMLDKLCDHEEALNKTRYQKSLLHKAAICHDTEELRTLIENEMKSENCDAEETSVSLEKVYGDVTIFRDYGLVFKDTYSTVYAPLAWIYRGCKVYFEIEVVENEFTDNLFSIGLINSLFLPPENRRGEDVAFWGSPPTQLGVKRYTVGVAIDIMNSQMLYDYGGNSIEIMTFSEFYDSFGLFPAIYGELTLQVNFGTKDFKFSPPNSTYKSVEELTKGTNILHVAARNNQVECCKCIIDDYPHLLNTTSGRGTPLHDCASTGAFNSMQVLLDAGADMTVTNIFGLTALEVAKINDQHECVKELERRLNGEELSVSFEGMRKKSLLSRLKQNFRKK